MRVTARADYAVRAAERWAVDAVDYEEGVPDAGIHLVVSEIMDADLPHEHFDGIFVSNFLEHLSSQDAVAAFLEKMHACTARGGRIAIMGPNFRYTAREYFDFADHSVILTERGVAEHLYAAGFAIERVHARFLPYSFTGRLPSSPALVRAYLRFPPAKVVQRHERPFRVAGGQRDGDARADEARAAGDQDAPAHLAAGRCAITRNWRPRIRHAGGKRR